MCHHLTWSQKATGLISFDGLPNGYKNVLAHDMLPSGTCVGEFEYFMSRSALTETLQFLQLAHRKKSTVTTHGQRLFAEETVVQPG